MGLDIYFYESELAGAEQIETESLGITHNLNTLVDECGKLSGVDYYKIIWRPDEILECSNGAVPSAYVLCYLPRILEDLLKYSVELKPYLPDNGYGTYEDLIEFVCKYIYMCYRNRQAYIYCCR